MIWTGIRVFDTRKIVEDMDACIAIKCAYPHLVSGYDLVGPRGWWTASEGSPSGAVLVPEAMYTGRYRDTVFLPRRGVRWRW